MCYGKPRSLTTRAFLVGVASLAAATILWQIVPGHSHKSPLSQVIAGTWYATYPHTTPNGEELTGEYILQLNASGDWNIWQFYAGGLAGASSSGGKWQLKNHTLRLLGADEAGSFLWRLLGMGSPPPCVSEWAVVSAKPNELVLQRLGAPLTFAPYAGQREADIRFLSEDR